MDPQHHPQSSKNGTATQEQRQRTIDNVLSREPSGYYKLAETLMGPYPEFAILRKFGALSALSLLSLQAELTQLELDLKRVSHEDALSSDQALRGLCSSFAAQLRQPEGQRKQWDLIVQIREKTKEYHAAVLQAASIASLSCPDKHNLQLLRDWLDDCSKDNQGSFLKGAEFFTWEPENDKDFVALRHRSEEDPLIRWFCAHAIHWYHGFLGRRKMRAREVVDLESGMVQYSDSKTAKLVILLASVISSVLPVVAIVILYFVRETETRIWIMICLTTVFAAVLATITSAKSQEIFAATAAFAAVEVVFIGSVSGAGGCSA